ncbi:testis-expressed protein 36 [Brachyistius frenatus]|uniref:testis-expressed protein 36 n=1 Tax=Brachyistius frenatus TaxID=100188 RepID=UPI0037E74338
MVKGGKRYTSVSTGGKWFAHPASADNEPKTRETCTSTGIMLSRVKSSLPEAFECYPKTQPVSMQIAQSLISKEYPFSDHDNKRALKGNISVFSHGVGLRKCPHDRRQQNSHFCLCHSAAGSSTEQTQGNLSAYKNDFTVKVDVRVPTRNRRFPRDHKHKSAEAALAQAEERFMWFGRDDSNFSETLQVLAATNCSAPS